MLGRLQNGGHSSLCRMRRLNCVLIGCKKEKLSSEYDDDDYDKSDVPLPAVCVKLTTQEFYDQHKDKVPTSTFILLFFRIRHCQVTSTY